MEKAKVAVFIGSASDNHRRPCADILKKLGIPFRFTVTSAHRTPERTAELVDSLEAAGCEVFICAAGMAAHLAGAVAARTMKPVIGIPVAASQLGGMDALLATVQMPPGFPVATVALDKAGARNAAWLAAQILALHDPELARKIRISHERFQSDVAVAGAGSKPSTVKFRKKSYGERGLIVRERPLLVLLSSNARAASPGKGIRRSQGIEGHFLMDPLLYE